MNLTTAVVILAVTAVALTALDIVDAFYRPDRQMGWKTPGDRLYAYWKRLNRTSRF